MVGPVSDTSGAGQTLAALARSLATIATSMRHKFVEYYARESSQEPLHTLVSTMLTNLIPGSTVADLADQVVQAITCGLATLRAISGIDAPFTPDTALEQLPPTHPFLRPFFAYILQGLLGGTRWTHKFLPAPLVEDWGIPNLFHLLDAPWVGSLFQVSTQAEGDLDPSIHLYETFLRNYDANKRAKRGVFYTPDALVSFIIRSVDVILRQDCGCPGGLLDPNAGNILDPATGTGTFLRHALITIKQDFLPRVWGCEVLLAPFVVAHILLGKALEETGFRFDENQRLKVYLVNALEVGLLDRPANRSQSTFDTHFTSTIDGGPPAPHEVDVARAAMEGATFHVIFGNPPYARKSQNVGHTIAQYMQPYKSAVQEERNIQALSNDYLKFLRFAEVLIDQSGWGVVGFVLNNRFLTGPIYRGVRESLSRTFDVLYVLNLHGGKKGYEQLPPETRDENVFPIAQGVCICLLVKRPSPQKPRATQIYYHGLCGSRTAKLDFLARANLKTVPWTTLPAAPPGSPFVLDLVPAALRAEWDGYTPLEDIFSFYNVGGKPGDDALLVSVDKEDVLPKLEAFIKDSRKGKEPSSAPLTEAKQKIMRRGDLSGLTKTHVEPYLYRPFDFRWVYYDRNVWTRAVPALKAQCHGTLLLLCAKIVIDPMWAHVLAATTFPDVILLSNSTSVNCYVFPTKVTDKDSGILGWNLTPTFQSYLSAMGVSCNQASEDDVMAFLYAILYSSSYRSRYDLLLRGGHFPRIPLVSSRGLFNQLSALGHHLLDLHADPGQFPSPVDIITNVPPGARIMPGFPRFHDNTIFISPGETFSPVPEEVWKFVVGKYCVCQQWLSARVGVLLSAGDISRFIQILGILRETIALMRQIDHAIASTGGFPVQTIPRPSLPAKVRPLRKAL